MKKHLITLIKAGTKRQTIRLWKSPRVHIGQLAFVPGLGRVRILAINRLPSLASLTRADALADGFATRRALLAEIRGIYGPVPDHAGRAIFRVRFAWPATAAARRPRRPGAHAARELLRKYVIARAP